MEASPAVDTSGLGNHCGFGAPLRLSGAIGGARIGWDGLLADRDAAQDFWTGPGLMAGAPGHLAAEEWLRAIGLGSHAAAFAAQDIGLAEIPELSEADLRELGLTIGERKRFRAAARSQAGDARGKGGAVARTLPERRPLSVMFVDMVDSTGHADRMEVEDLIETVRIYREFCDRTIGQFGGHVAQFYGDGIMAYFCYPVAHENDAERAVRAGLAIAAGVRDVGDPGGRAHPCPRRDRHRAGGDQRPVQRGVA